MRHYSVKIDGMGCEGCVAAVTEAIEALAGIRAVTVDLAGGKAELDAEPALDEPALRRALEQAGYAVTAVTG